jgi:hypothetical protein
VFVYTFDPGIADQGGPLDEIGPDAPNEKKQHYLIGNSW